jgi:hypothetical protein
MPLLTAEGILLTNQKVALLGAVLRCTLELVLACSLFPTVHES